MTPVIRQVCSSIALASALLLVGCATVSPDGGTASLQSIAHQLPTGPARHDAVFPRPGVDASAEISALLQLPLSADSAVRIARLNNPGLQQSLASQGVDITNAALASHPAKIKATQDAALLGAQVRKAWIRAVAAGQSAQTATGVKEAAEAGGELARRMARAGNWSPLQQARQQVFLADAAADLIRAQETAFSARERLTVLLGLWGQDAERYILPAQLPDLPDAPRNETDLERRVLERRQELTLAAVQWQRQLTRPAPRGSDALWDALGEAAHVRGLAVQARSEAREALFRYRTRYDLARHHDKEIVPLSRFINDEMVLRYNGMLSSVFDLLAESRAGAQAHARAMDARRDFWLADTDLDTVLSGLPLSFSDSAAESASTGSSSQPAGH